jgi:hypothetical protein
MYVLRLAITKVLLVNLTTLDIQRPCPIENLSIVGRLKSKEHYKDNTSILMTWNVAC